MSNETAVAHRNAEVSGALKQINLDIRQALADEVDERPGPSSARSVLSDRVRSRPLTLSVGAAAVRFRNACDVSIRRTADDSTPSPTEVIEMEQATRKLMYASNTTTIEEALDVLSEFES